MKKAIRKIMSIVLTACILFGSAAFIKHNFVQEIEVEPEYENHQAALTDGDVLDAEQNDTKESEDAATEVKTEKDTEDESKNQTQEQKENQSVKQTMEQTKKETVKHTEKREPKPEKKNPPKKQNSASKQPQPNKKPASSPVKKPAPKKGKGVTDAQLQRIVDKFFSLINAERARKNINPLRINSHLDACAQIRANEILNNFSHIRPNGTYYYTLIDGNYYRYSTVGENLVYSSHIGNNYYYPDRDYWVGSEKQINDAANFLFMNLKNSPAHYSLIVSPNFKDTGIGISCTVDSNNIVTFYISQIFAA